MPDGPAATRARRSQEEAVAPVGTPAEATDSSRNRPPRDARRTTTGAPLCSGRRVVGSGIQDTRSISLSHMPSKRASVSRASVMSFCTFFIW